MGVDWANHSSGLDPGIRRRGVLLGFLTSLTQVNLYTRSMKRGYTQFSQDYLPKSIVSQRVFEFAKVVHSHGVEPRAF